MSSIGNPADPGATMLPAPGGPRVEPIPAGGIDLRPLLVKVTGRTLIRPAEVQAAVKSDGTAERLVKQLKLEGVVTMGGTSVAYIRVKQDGLKAVREGDSVLEFSVKRVEPDKVTLSLQGVTVPLDNR